MSLKMILGRSGSGKTDYCLHGIRRRLKESPYGAPLILLVPEQATFQLEKELACTPGLGGLVRAQVLSFRRLARKVLLEAGGVTREYIGELGKYMVLRKCLEEHRKELRIFGRAVEKPGFGELLSETISEIKRYLLTPEQLKGSSNFLRQKGEKLLAEKLHDLSLLYHQFQKALGMRSLDPDDLLTLLAGKIGHAAFLRGAEIWMDGFTGFTPQEFFILEGLLKNTKRLHVALCLDPRTLKKPLEDEECFYVIRETYEKLMQLALKAGVRIEQAVILDTQVPSRFRNNKVIAHLQEHIFTHPAPVFQQEPHGVKLVAAVNRRAEVEGVAREILRLSRTKGYRYREMAVVLRDINEYLDLIPAVFQDFGIAFFMDQKRSMIHHPLIEFIRSVLQMVIDNWAYEPLFQCLKTDLVPLTRDQVDCLENYVLAHGIRGRAWTDAGDWHYCRRSLGQDEVLDAREEDNLGLVNKIKKEVQRWLLHFNHRVKTAENVRDLTTALYDLLSDLKVPEQLERWCEEAVRQGNLEEAREHAQVWDAVMELFDQMEGSLGDEKLTLSDYLKVLESGLENLKVGLIPPGLDQVLVASLGRSRVPDVKAVFILGANEGKFPARPADESLLTDQEREYLLNVGLQLAPGGHWFLLNEQFLVYSALTRASDFLWVSYNMADDEGRALVPSHIVNRLRELAPRLKTELSTLEPEPDADPLEFITVPRRSLSYLVSRLREHKNGVFLHPAWLEVYNWFVSTNTSDNYCRRVLASLFHVNQEKRIDRELGAGLYGDPLRASVSRLEEFQACPFQHFLSRGLSLKERAIFGLDALDYGLFYHAALKGFTDELEAEGRDWGELSENESGELVAKVVAELAPRLQSEILLSSARYRYIKHKLEQTVRRVVEVLTEHARRGAFRPVGSELSFGPAGELPSLKLKLDDENELELAGRIDRVDVAQHGEGNYIRVIDYKSGKQIPNLEDIYYGLSLQLPVYLEVCLENSDRLGFEKAEPAGMFCFKVDNPLLNWKKRPDRKAIKRAMIREFKMRGMLLADAEVVRLMDKQLVSGYSDLLAVALKKDGSFYSNAPAFTREQFGTLRWHLKKILHRTGTGIIQGEVAISPYKKGGFTSCRYCTYKVVCQFDTLFAENKYRMLSPRPVETIWRELEARKKGERRE